MVIKRGDMFYADLSPVVGSEQGGIRPVLIIQNDMGNKYSPTVIAAAITSQMNKTKLPTHIEIDSEQCGLKNDSVVLAEQIRTIDKSRLKEKIGHIEDEQIINKGPVPQSRNFYTFNFLNTLISLNNLSIRAFFSLTILRYEVKTSS